MRHPMLHAPLGWTSKATVLEKLGCDWTAYNNSPNNTATAEKCLKWPLGMCSGLGMDYDSFVVCFDKSNMVERSFHYQS